jgi:predicted transcriptional regulator of viral defense system
MRFIDFKEQLKGFTVFSLPDIRMVDTTFDLRRLTEWRAKGYIRKIVRGHYIFSDTAVSEPVLYAIANRIYPPSYVSCETALAWYGLIPESAYATVSVSTRKTARFSTGTGVFLYRTVAPRLFFGNDIAVAGGVRFTIAGVEKALMDFLYLHPDLREPEDMESLRINAEAFHTRVNEDNLMAHVERAGFIALAGRVTILRRYMNNA